MSRGFEKYHGLSARAENKMQAVKEMLELYMYLHPLKSKYLEQRFKLRGNEIRAIMSELSCQDEPICSGPKGYYWATCAGDIDKTIDHLTDRCTRMQNRIKGLKRARMKMITRISEPEPEQIKLI